MKSFYQHLSSRQEFGESIDVTRKPIFRSSAIFPVIKNVSYTTNILFLGYWLLKRKIHEVNMLITLRDKEGKILKRNSLIVDSPRSYSVELNSLLENTQHLQGPEFLGSIEIEIFSTRDMVFPYPALVLNYYNKDFNTCVHTIGRVYNDFEDLDENEKFRVPETGFDIHANEDIDSFVAFVNGPLTNLNGSIKYVVTNNNSQKFRGDFHLSAIKPYQTVLLKFRDHIPDLDKMLNGKPGTITLEHNFNGFYPRFLAGNIQKSLPSVSFTHTYYDCSSCSAPSDYWNRISDKYHDCSVYVPLFIENDFYTEFVIYPNFSPSIFDLHINLHDKQGRQLHQFPSFLKIDSKDSKLIKINFKELIEKHGIDASQVKTAHIISDFKDAIPTRLKFGLNIGINNSKSKLPCNICFNAKVGNPLIENKPGSFHWCPIFNTDQTIISIANSSPQKNYQKPANVTLRFYNKALVPLERKILLPANSEFRLDMSSDDELKSLTQDGPAWITIEADNPNMQGYYFNFNKSGSVAGDHFF